MSDSDFCTNCGKPVNPAEDVYCPNCGAAVKGGPADAVAKEAYKAATNSTAIWAAVFLFIAALPSLIWGIYAIADNTAIAQYYVDWYNSMGETIGMSFDSLTQYIEDLGIVALAVGLIGILGGVLCYLRRYWWIVLIITMVVLFFGVFTFIGLFLGLFAMWFVFMSRDAFTS